jgi:hypothetical protein
MQSGPFLGPGSGEDLLGQRGTVVGFMRLIADEADPAGESLCAEELDGTQPAQPSANDHHVTHAPSDVRGTWCHGSSAHQQLAVAGPELSAFLFGETSPNAVRLSRG